MIREEEVFKIGQFAKPHGIKGELSLVTNSDVLEDAEDPYIVCEMDGILVPFFVEDFRYKTDTVVLVKPMRILLPLQNLPIKLPQLILNYQKKSVMEDRKSLPALPSLYQSHSLLSNGVLWELLPILRKNESFLQGRYEARSTSVLSAISVMMLSLQSWREFLPEVTVVCQM